MWSAGQPHTSAEQQADVSSQIFLTTVLSAAPTGSGFGEACRKFARYRGRVPTKAMSCCMNSAWCAAPPRATRRRCSAGRSGRRPRRARLAACRARSPNQVFVRGATMSIVIGVGHALAVRAAHAARRTTPPCWTRVHAEWRQSRRIPRLSTTLLLGTRRCLCRSSLWAPHDTTRRASSVPRSLRSLRP